jgi:hypothetical protein
MSTKKVITASSKVFIGFSIFSVGYVSILSLINPIATMELVNTPLPNNDAISSIRGIFGGVGIVITISLIFLLLKDLTKGLSFLTLFWGAYAISRIITILADGPLGDFGNQWLTIESTLCITGLILLILNKKHALND